MAKAFGDIKLDLALFISEFGKAALALFIIVDPFGNIPIFVGLTENVQDAQKKKVYNTATIVGVILLLVFAFAGTGILSLFGLSIYSFEVAGGIPVSYTHLTLPTNREV